MTRRPSEAGSAIFYILIAIVLFAALGFAVSNSNRGASPNNAQQLELRASEILNFTRNLHTAVQSMQIAGVTENQVSFDTPVLNTLYANTNCVTEACKVFSPSGGGLSYAKAQNEWLNQSQAGGTNFGDWVFTGNNAVTGVGTDGNGDASADLVVILPWIRKDLCVQINVMLNIPNPSDNPPQDAAQADIADKFTGTYTGTSVIGTGNTQIPRQRTGCFQDSGPAATAPYYFYEVLLAR